MDVQNINTFTETIVTTFETACNATPFRYADFERLEGDIKNQDDLICGIDFSGSLTGSVVMTFPGKTAAKVYGGMMMEDVDDLNDEVVEGFSEILNMVIGNVKASLTNHQLNFEQPKTSTEKGYVYKSHGHFPWIKIPMAFKEWGKFNLLISIKETG